MRTLLLLLLFSISLLATELVKYNIYQNADRIDLMLTFDKPYSGKISKSQTPLSTVLILNDIDFKEKKAVKKTDSFIDSLTIAATEKGLLIELKPKEEITVNASKTIDNTGLRIRIKKSIQTEEESIVPIRQTDTKPLQEYDFGTSFLKVTLILGSLIVFLWFLKKWLYKKSSNNWLFGEDSQKYDMKILMQRAIDMKNRVVLVSFEDKKYLLLLGENNLLLDTFTNDEAAFESLLRKDSKKLGDFLEE